MKPASRVVALTSLLVAFGSLVWWLTPIGEDPALARDQAGAMVLVASDVDDVGERTRAAERSPLVGYTAAVGTRLHFDLEVATSVGLQRPEHGGEPPAAAPFELSLRGVFEQVVLGRRGDGLLVGCRVVEACITVGGEPTPETLAHVAALQQVLLRGFDVRMDHSGQPEAVRCRGDWSPDQRGFARALVAVVHCEFEPRAAWSSTFVDTMGEHSFDHAAAADGGDVCVVRTRTGFRPRDCEGEVDTAVVADGRADGRFAAAAGWLTGIVADDAVAWSLLGGSMRVAARAHASMQWTGSDAIAVDGDPDWDSDFVGLGDRAPVVATADPMRAFWQERLHGRSVQDLLGELAALLARGGEQGQEHLELLQLIAERVRQDPAEARRLGALVAKAQLTGQVAADALATLGMAGHDEAQLALAEVATNGLVEPGLRQAAIESTLQIERPCPGLVASLQGALYGVRLDGLAGSAMLALGAFASRGAVTGDGRPLAAELLGLEATARRDGVEPAYFEALGNTGDPAVMPRAVGLLRSVDAVERAWGLCAMRRVRTPGADAVLRGVARTDASADVRRQAVEQIAAVPDGWATDILLERAAADAEPEVRRQACSGLAIRARTDARVRAALQERAASEPDAELRAWLCSLVAGA